MNKIIIFGIVGAVIVAGGGFLIYNQISEKSAGIGENGLQENISESEPKPWIEVVTPSVFELKAGDSSEIRELKTGDEINPGNIIDVRETGLANIYFFDGSLARIDSETKLVVSEASFNKENKSLTVKIKLSVGRVWSKILALVNPASLWEVKTTNAVATVRGTAFGIEYKEGKTSAIGSEKEITVEAIDPETGEIIKDAKAVIGAGKFLEIKEEEIKNIKARPEILAISVRDAPAEILKQDWVKRNKAEDLKFEEKLNEFQQSFPDEKKSGEEFQKIIREELTPKTEEQKVLEETRTKEQEGEEKLFPVKQEEPAGNEGTGSAFAPKIGEPQELVLATKNNLSNISEGDKIVFQAILRMSDGTKQDVTNSAVWQVLGGIGSMESAGVFVAKLDVSVAELGESSGTIIAVWRDAQKKFSLLAKSPFINVKAVIGGGAEQME